MFFKVENLSKHFYGVQALNDVTIEVQQHDLLGLIGPNGSGKTTLFNCVTGYLSPEQGQVFYQGREVSGFAPQRIALAGISRTFQQERVFGKLTVMENMLASVQEYQENNPLARIVRTRHVRRLEEEGRERAQQLLKMVSLDRLSDHLAGELSYGQRKLLGFASALMSEPRLLLLDEPTAGVNLTIIEAMKQHIRTVHEEGTVVILVEHNMDVVMDLCNRLVVLDHGEKIAEGQPHVVRHDERVLEAYFGT